MSERTCNGFHGDDCPESHRTPPPSPAPSPADLPRRLLETAYEALVNDGHAPAIMPGCDRCEHVIAGLLTSWSATLRRATEERVLREAAEATCEFCAPDSGKGPAEKRPGWIGLWHRSRERYYTRCAAGWLRSRLAALKGEP